MDKDWCDLCWIVGPYKLFCAWEKVDNPPGCVVIVRRGTHTEAHTFWWVVLHCRNPLPDQQCSLGFFRSLSPSRASSSPRLSYYTNATPLLLISLFYLSVSLINVKRSNNKAAILSVPASSGPHICHCVLTLPLHQLVINLSRGRNSGPHCQHERLFRGSIRKRQNVRSRYFSHFCLFFLPSSSQKKKGMPQSFT